MRIVCPHCGDRGLDEFLYYGDASVTRPDSAASTAMEDFTRYVYERANLAGSHAELWYHSAGCHAWLVVTRNVVDHQISAVELARDVARRKTPTSRGGS